MGFEVEIRVQPALNSLLERLTPLLHGTEQIECSSFLNVDGKQHCSITTEESRKTNWRQCCEFSLEDPNRIYVLAHLGKYLEMVQRLAEQLEADGFGVEFVEI